MIWQIVHRAARAAARSAAAGQPDGSILVGWGAPLQPMSVEYDATGHPMLSISQTPFGYSYRIVKYPITDFDVTQLRATAGGTAVGHP